MEPVPLPVHVYIVAPDCFRAEYFIKKKLFPHNFSPRQRFQSKTFIIFSTATNWIGWIVVPDFIQPIATWETFHFMHACIKMLILFKPRIRATNRSFACLPALYLCQPTQSQTKIL